MEIKHVHTQLYKLDRSGSCSGLFGKIMTSLIVDPPLPGDSSDEQFCNEKTDIFESLVRRFAALVKVR